MIKRQTLKKNETITITIYSIINPKGQIYIGVTSNFTNRIAKYKSKANTKNQRLVKQSLEKYGFDNHEFNVLYYKTYDNKQNIMRSIIKLENKYILETYKKNPANCLNIYIPNFPKNYKCIV